MLSTIIWNVDPEMFNLPINWWIFGTISVRWYGLLFAMGFFLGYNIVERMFKREGIQIEWLDKLFMYTMIATVVGARLGHVFFYGWDYYSHNLLEIFKIWHGGLASHGATLGIIIALFIYSKNVSKKPFLWILDFVVVPVALACFFIRFGNLMNSEIIGTKTDLPWAFVFKKAYIADPEAARHPAQLYESICYLITFATMMIMYWKTEAKKHVGLLSGVFFILVFGSRFFIEFIKEDQENFEAAMTLNMGQWLSIPCVIAGIYFIIQSKKKKIA